MCSTTSLEKHIKVLFRSGSYSALWSAKILKVLRNRAGVSLGMDEHGEELSVEGIIQADTETVELREIHKGYSEGKNTLFTFVLSTNCNTKPCTYLYSVNICWIKYVIEIGRFHIEEGLECQAEEFGLCHQIKSLTFSCSRLI